eukprot:scaffold552023_cov36-Prasinocladus_malaysianus.AAC.1
MKGFSLTAGCYYNSATNSDSGDGRGVYYTTTHSSNTVGRKPAMTTRSVDIFDVILFSLTFSEAVCGDPTHCNERSKFYLVAGR